MNDDASIEKLLRQAPRRPPPKGLLESIQSNLPRRPAAPELREYAPWWRRWAPAGAFLICFSALLGGWVSQRLEISRLSGENKQLRQEIQEAERQQRERSLEEESSRVEWERLKRDHAEMQRLAPEVATLEQELAALPALREEWMRLEQEKRSALSGGVDSDNPFARAKQAAQKAACISNLKQIALAGAIHAKENRGTLPHDMLFLKNHLQNVPVCPASTENQPKTFDEINTASYSYLLLAPGARSKPDQIVFGCRVHPHFSFGDGSVHEITDPDRLKQLMGKGEPR